MEFNDFLSKLINNMSNGKFTIDVDGNKNVIISYNREDETIRVLENGIKIKDLNWRDINLN